MSKFINEMFRHSARDATRQAIETNVMLCLGTKPEMQSKGKLKQCKYSDAQPETQSIEPPKEPGLNVQSEAQRQLFEDKLRQTRL